MEQEGVPYSEPFPSNAKKYTNSQEEEWLDDYWTISH